MKFSAPRLVDYYRFPNRVNYNSPPSACYVEDVREERVVSDFECSV